MTKQVLELLNDRALELGCKDWNEYKDNDATQSDSDMTFECLYSIIDKLLNENKELQRKFDYIIDSSGVKKYVPPYP